VASTQSVDVGQRHRQQIWIAATDGLVERRNDDAMGRRYCYQLRTAILHPGGLHYVVLRPWTAVNRPGLSVGTLFRTSGGHNFSLRFQTQQDVIRARGFSFLALADPEILKREGGQKTMYQSVVI